MTLPKQNLCEHGVRLRNRFFSMTFAQTLEERRLITEVYFKHKRDCWRCDKRWWGEA